MPRKTPKIEPGRTYNITELAALSGLVDATLWCRLKTAKVLKDEDLRYLGADLLDAQARGANLFRPPAPLGKGLIAAHAAKKALDAAKKGTDEGSDVVGKAIKLADGVRALVSKSGLPAKTAAAALSCVAASLK